MKEKATQAAGRKREERSNGRSQRGKEDRVKQIIHNQHKIIQYNNTNLKSLALNLLDQNE